MIIIPPADSCKELTVDNIVCTEISRPCMLVEDEGGTEAGETMIDDEGESREQLEGVSVKGVDLEVDTCNVSSCGGTEGDGVSAEENGSVGGKSETPVLFDEDASSLL